MYKEGHKGALYDVLKNHKFKGLGEGEVGTLVKTLNEVVMKDMLNHGVTESMAPNCR